MAVYECILKPGHFNGKRGRFIGGWKIIVSRPLQQSLSACDIEREMVREFGDEAKGCGYIGYWDIRKIK